MYTFCVHEIVPLINNYFSIYIFVSGSNYSWYNSLFILHHSMFNILKIPPLYYTTSTFSLSRDILTRVLGVKFGEDFSFSLNIELYTLGPNVNN